MRVSFYDIVKLDNMKQRTSLADTCMAFLMKRR